MNFHFYEYFDNKKTENIDLSIGLKNKSLKLQDELIFHQRLYSIQKN